MSVKVVSVLCSLVIYETFFGCSLARCPGEPCKCENGFLECICNQNGIRENITLGTGLSSELNRITTVTVHHCGVVLVETSAFMFKHIDALEFYDLDELRIKEFAFFNLQAIEHVNISNVKKFVPKKHVFYVISNVTDVYISDVEVDILDSGFFGVSYTNFFTMMNVVINSIDDQAIHIDHVNVFSIWNSKIENLYTNGIRLNGSTQQMFLRNTSIGMAEADSIVCNEVSMFMLIDNCHFALTHNSFLKATNVTKMAFKNNKIERCETDAFDSVVVRDELEFTGNQFEKAIDQCLPANFSRPIKTIVSRNNFVCNCDLEWFFQNDFALNYPYSTCTIYENDTLVDKVKTSDFKLKYHKGTCTNEVDKLKPVIDVPVPVKGDKTVSSGKPNFGLRNAASADLYTILFLSFLVKAFIN